MKGIAATGKAVDCYWSWPRIYRRETFFFIQMPAIEQSHFEREEERLAKEDSARKKEKKQIAEQRELDNQRMAEQHDYFARLLEEVRRPQEQTPPPTPRLTIQ